MRLRSKGNPGGCFILFGLLFTGVGLFSTIFISSMMREEASRIEAMRPLGAVVLDDSRPGREVLAEGRISDRNQEQAHGLVAYVYEQRERDSEGDYVWRTRDQITPRLLIDVPDGRIEVAARYSLRNLPDENTVQQNSERYRGLQQGDAVVVVGTTVASSELPTLNAEFIAGGTQQTYVTNHRAGAGAASVFGWIFAGAGILFVLIGALLLLR